MQRKKRKNSTMEFSKKIFVIISTLFIVVIGYSMLLMWYTKDTSPLAYLIPSAGGLMMVCVGFYYWKARMENCIRISQSERADVIDKINQINEYSNMIENLGNNQNYG